MSSQAKVVPCTSPHEPPHAMRVQCALILPRLRLIPEFESWLDQSSSFYRYRDQEDFYILWNCFSLGAPFTTLLDLLGPPSGVHREYSDPGSTLHLGFDNCKSHIISFIQGVQVLELQGRLPYGEGFKIEDLLEGSYTGFAKVIRTIDRFLKALQATYPGLYYLPSNSEARRVELLNDFLKTEKDHVSAVLVLVDSALFLSDKLRTKSPLMECLAMAGGQTLPYHRHALECVELMHPDLDWQKTFNVDDILWKTAITAYRSICAQYLEITSILEKVKESYLVSPAKAVLDLLSHTLRRVSYYRSFLKTMTTVLSPVEHPTFNLICQILLDVKDSAETIDDVGQQARSTRTLRDMSRSGHAWHNYFLHELGDFVLDDCLIVDGSDLKTYLALFENVLMCFQSSDGREEPHENRTYPIQSWEQGPIMERINSLTFLYSVATKSLRYIRAAGSNSLEIKWEHKGGLLRTLVFLCRAPAQCDQWLLTLRSLQPRFNESLGPLMPSHTSIHSIDDDDQERENVSQSVFELLSGTTKRRGSGKTWSLAARKEAHSESSSLFQERSPSELLISPSWLPTLFKDIPASPSSSASVDLSSFHSEDHDHENSLVTASVTSISSSNISDFSTIADLTGEVTPEGKYPVAHGGFADVWKANWKKGMEQRQVAVKAIRSKIDDPFQEVKMKRRLRRELCVWQKLHHENVLELYGVTSDFGHYSSMVCPWMVNGSVSKYLERLGATVSLHDRLQLLCEIAAGLAYLHSFDVIHGDLTGSNILIDDAGRACLCDFGLSSIAAEFHGTSYLTSSIGGNVRWAAAELYRIYEDNELPAITKASDMYSFGSVMLEILSGQIPYFYVKSDAQVVIELHRGVKPRRPVYSLVSAEHWDFIQRCWASPSERPNIANASSSIGAFLKPHLSREARRNTL